MPGRIVGTLVVTLFVTAAGLTVTGQSEDPWVGTWKLDVPPSNANVRSLTVRLEAIPNGVRTVTDSVDAKGNATHTEITGMFDGKEYEMKGAAMPTTRVYRRVGRDYEYETRVNGKLMNISRGAVSADGKTRTVTTTGTDAQGKPTTNVAILQKQ